jgi:alanine dehydrogenase
MARPQGWEVFLIIGCPKERAPFEGRVGLTPAGVSELVARGHRVLFERGAGAPSGLPDVAYEKAGAELVDTAAELWALAGMVVKVKEPTAAECKHLRSSLIVLSYLHLAAAPDLAHAFIDSGATAVAYETIQLDDGALPCLAPMSSIAGRMAVQIGAQRLETGSGGKGLLLSGVPGVRRGRVTILGAGVAGSNAARLALGIGARVSILDTSLRRLVTLEDTFGPALETLHANVANIARAVAEADLVIGAVLVPGARAPILVTEEMIHSMEPGSVVIDVAVDQGGCVATSRPTTHAEPTFTLHGVVHYGVPNMPGAVAKTSTLALSNAALPYAIKLAELGIERAVERDAALARGVNAYRGQLTQAHAAQALGLPHTPPLQAIEKARG